MHKQHILCSMADQLMVNLVVGEMFKALFLFLFLSHGGKDIGGYQVGASDRGHRVIGDGHALARLGQQLHAGLVAGGAGDIQVEVEQH